MNDKHIDEAVGSECLYGTIIMKAHWGYICLHEETGLVTRMLNSDWAEWHRYGKYGFKKGAK